MLSMHKTAGYRGESNDSHKTRNAKIDPCFCHFAFSSFRWSTPGLRIIAISNEDQKAAAHLITIA
jgi:hypothetical protein